MLVWKPTKDAIELASKLLKAGEIVAVPTETVYGLAGDSRNPAAIKKIFEAKGRPQDNPLIVHIASVDMLEGLVENINETAKKLMSAFWPGPLTIIMPKGKLVCKETCSGLDSVGVRMPANEIAREIIKKSGVPFAAPSANLSGKPSPTSAEDVFNDMNGRIPLIIDDGESFAGVESTVISCLDKIPIILRPGVITKEMIEKVLGFDILVSKQITEGVKPNEKVLSPGMKYKHYAPRANVVIVKGSFDKFKEFVEKQTDDGLFALVFDEEISKLKVNTLAYGKKGDSLSQAHNLFKKLRELDKKNAKTVYARCPETEGVGMAVYNRLIRAAAFRVINLD